MHGGGGHHPEEHPGTGEGGQLQYMVACCGRVGASELKKHSVFIKQYILFLELICFVFVLDCLRMTYLVCVLQAKGV